MLVLLCLLAFKIEQNEYAVEVAATLAYSSIQSRDKVGYIILIIKQLK